MKIKWRWSTYSFLRMGWNSLGNYHMEAHKGRCLLIKASPLKIFNDYINLVRQGPLVYLESEPQALLLGAERREELQECKFQQKLNCYELV
ncbi:conserved hypothetical protein [Ricinus communis]|uniref:Uncharacterized protein n=1 Tax=Ricinus communis TaxID=3988 RepID=B9RUV5_RICCO|nr:conserved hypothetical protein [Ricinus communis]